eukprot:8322513-Lingulodinium_polyedra.AAC.1
MRECPLQGLDCTAKARVQAKTSARRAHACPSQNCASWGCLGMESATPTGVEGARQLSTPPGLN